MDFQTLKANLLDWLGKDDVSLPESVRGLIVNMAIREYLRTLDLRFGEKIGSLAAVGNQEYTALPADFSRPYSLWYLKDGSKIDVDYLSKEEYDIKYPDTSETDADIVHYCIFGGKVYWGPVPSANLTVTFNYYCYLADLSAPADHNDFTDLAWEAIFFRALCFATQYGIEDARLPMWQQEAMKQENKLILEHSRRSAGRRPVNRDYGYTGA
jgi:hypothetical protein